MKNKDIKKKDKRITNEQKEKAIRLVKRIGVGFSIGLNVLIGLTLIIGSIGAKDTNEHTPVSTDQVSEVAPIKPKMLNKSLSDKDSLYNAYESIYGNYTAWFYETIVFDLVGDSRINVFFNELKLQNGLHGRCYLECAFPFDPSSVYKFKTYFDTIDNLTFNRGIFTLSTTYNNISTTHTFSNGCKFLFTNDSDIGSLYMTRNLSELLYGFNILPKDSGTSAYNTITFSLPPFIAIDKDTKSFKYYISFMLNDKRYYGIEYKYHDSFTFLGNENLIFKLGISENGESYIFRPYYHDYDMLHDKYVLKLLSFGKLGFNYLNGSFIPNYNNYLSGTYYTNKSIIESLVHSFHMAKISQDWSVSAIFSSGSKFYNELEVHAYYQDNTNTEIFRVWYYGGGGSINYLVDMTYKPGGDGYKYTTFNEDLLNVTFDNVLYSNSLFQVLSGVYYPVKVISFDPHDNNNSSIGGTGAFDLIGHAFTSFANIFSIQLLPGLAIGTLFFIPLIVLIVLSIVGLFKR